MTAALAHRGPDGQGVALREGVAIGNRRLAIIDLEGGAQPMTDETGSLWLTQNGEIYNFLELRTELEEKGHGFSTRSDTEVVLRAYAEWGANCVERLRGMFAFALVDWRKQQVLLARDAFGIKPLHYRLGSGYFAFASELSALRRIDGDQPRGDLQAIDDYLRYQYIPAPRTAFRDVRKLPPATYLVAGLDGRVGDPIRYWSPRFEPEEGSSDGEWEERVESALRSSVKAHLVADVPFGVLLSGGVDSTLIAQEMSRVLGHPVKAFAAGFHEREYSELSWAREAARQLSLDLDVTTVGDLSLEDLPELLDHYGEPFGDSSALATLAVARLARASLPMVLSGDGGDELFAGYDSYLDWMAENAATGAPGARPGDGASGSSSSLPSGWLSDWTKRITYFDAPARRQLWRPPYRELAERPCEPFEAAARRSAGAGRLAFAQLFDLQTYLPGAVLTKVDVASMFCGLEVRTPFLDRELFEVAARLPASQRIRRDRDGRLVGKHLLRRLLGRTFPPAFVHRAKQGFAIPRARWFLPGQLGRRRLESLLLEPRSPLNRWFDPLAIAAQVELHDRSLDNSGPLWLLFALAHWLERNSSIEFS